MATERTIKNHSIQKPLNIKKQGEKVSMKTSKKIATRGRSTNIVFTLFRRVKLKFNKINAAY